MKYKDRNMQFKYLLILILLLMAGLYGMSGCKQTRFEEQISEEVVDLNPSTPVIVDEVSNDVTVSETRFMTLENLCEIQALSKTRQLTMDDFADYSNKAIGSSLTNKAYPIEGKERLSVLLYKSNKKDGKIQLSLRYLSPSGEGQYSIIPEEMMDETVQEFIDRFYERDAYLVDIEIKGSQVIVYEIPIPGKPKLIRLAKEDQKLILTYEDGSEKVIENCPETIMDGSGFHDVCYIKDNQIYFNIDRMSESWQYIANKKVWRQYDAPFFLQSDQICTNGLIGFNQFTYDELKDRWESYYTETNKYLAGSKVTIDENVVLFVDDMCNYDEKKLKEVIPHLKIQEVTENNESIHYSDAQGEEWVLSNIIRHGAVSYGHQSLTDALIRFDENGGQVIAQSVRLFAVDDSGVLFAGYRDEAYATYYNFDDGKIYPIQSINPVDAVALQEDAIYLTSGEMIYKMSVNELIADGESVHIDSVAVQKETTVFDQLLFESYSDSYRTVDVSVLDQIIPIETKSGTRLLVKRVDRINYTYCLYDWETERWIDQIHATAILKVGDLIYLSLNGFILEYNPLLMTYRMVKFDPFPGEFFMASDQILLYGIYYDDGMGFGTTSLNADFLRDDWQPKDKDLYIIRYSSLYDTSVFIYDNRTKRLTLLIQNGWCQVEETEDGFRYQTFDNQNNPSGWIAYKVDESKTFQFFNKSDR